MGDSKIEWTDRSDWNPVRGCTRITEACTHCYAEAIAARFSDPGAAYHGFATRTSKGPRWTGKVALLEERLAIPFAWRKLARVFPNSMSDLFHEDLPDEAIDKIFAVMALCPHHTFQVLTKRPARMRDYMLETWQGTPAQEFAGMKIPAGGVTGRRSQVEAACEPFLEKLGLVDTENDALWTADGGCKAMQWKWPLPNVWLGTSVHDQASADEFIPLLLDTPAAVRFVSYEPALGAVDFRPWLSADDGCQGCDDGIMSGVNRCGRTDIPRDEQCPRNFAVERAIEHGPYVDGCPASVTTERVCLDWIICGGESGPHARPMHPDWARQTRDQCAAAGVAFHFKQWGEWICERAATAQHDAPGPEMFDRDGRPHGDRWKFWPDALHAGDASIRVGKKRAGRLLDGHTHDDFPAPR